jgi:hypothetical protein
VYLAIKVVLLAQHGSFCDVMAQESIQKWCVRYKLEKMTDGDGKHLLKMKWDLRKPRRLHTDDVCVEEDSAFYAPFHSFQNGL